VDFRRLVDVGDLVLLEGTAGHSRTGTPSLLVSSWQVLAKSLHPIPFDHLNGRGSRLPNRSLELLVHPELRQPLRARAAVLASLRRTLGGQGFLEVETPILHTVHGGASARPFTTASNAYGLELSLRIAPELYLKQLLVGGLGPVFEIGRSFRNEGADATHNPEFTSLEAYLPYADYTTMRQLTELLVKEAATAVHGRPLLRLRGGPDGDLTDVSAPWPAVPFLEALSAALGTPVGLDTDYDQLLALARLHHVPVRTGTGPGALLEALYARLVEARTTAPTFYTDFPEETSPLTAGHRSHPGLVERWDLVVSGMEIATAYSELTNPLEQRRRLTAQAWKAAHGDEEAMEVDEAFLSALELGMAPCGGLGLGVDRLLMLLTADSIKEVLTFPFTRPR
jgi:lysyl-tRNA synthetase class 2